MALMEQIADTIEAKNPGIKLRKIMGRTYLHEDRIKDAVEIYLGILDDDPDDVDTLLELGNLYLASGNGRTAAQLFRRVLALAPERTIIQKQLQLASSEEEEEMPEEPVPTSPDAISRLLQRLTGNPEPVSEQEVRQAYQMLHQIMSSPHPGDEVAMRLEEITSLLPALIELNIRQARADGNAEVAGALQNLQINIALQKSADEAPEDSRSRKGQRAAVRKRFKGHVFMLLPDKNFLSPRMALVAESLREYGCKVSQGQDLSGLRSEKPDMVLSSNPHLNPLISQYLAACSAARVPVVVDHDIDFEKLPVFHPDYATRGPGRQAVSKAYNASLALADVVTVPSRVLAQSLTDAGHCVECIPDGWMKEDDAPGHRPVPGEISLGWVGSGKLIEDLAMIRRVIIRVLYEFENTRMVVIGSQQGYQLLESVPPERKFYLSDLTEESGAVRGEDSRTPSKSLASLIRGLDVLLVPLNGHPFNQSQSDRLLMEAGRCGVPWIASSAPAFIEWGGGGLVATSRDEWHTYLRQLILDPQLRQSLGAEGARRAEQREMKQTGSLWIALIEQILQKKHVSAGRAARG